MANNIIAQVAGGQKRVLDNVATVADVAAQVGASAGYTASVNGAPAEFTQGLDENDMVTFAKAVKGGLA